MIEQRCDDSPDAALMAMYGCVVDYACRHRHLDVLYEVSRCVACGLSSLLVPHVRLAGACLYKLVQCDDDDAADFSTAVQLAQLLFEAVGTSTDGALLRCYAKLLCGLKVKALFHCLQSSPKDAMCLLRKFFPPHPDDLHKQLSVHNAALAKKIQRVIEDFRRCFVHLVVHRGKREQFFRREHRRLYGPAFSRHLTHRAATFLEELEKSLPGTFLDEVLLGNVTADKTPDNTPTLLDILMDVMLECVQGKTTLTSADLLNLLEELRRLCNSPSREEVRRSALRMRLVSSSEGQSISSWSSSGSQRSSGAELTSQSTLLDTSRQTPDSVATDAASQQPSERHGNQSTESPETEQHPQSSKTCVGCRQSRRIKSSAVHANRYYGQQGMYVSPPCHVRLSYNQIYQDLSGSQHFLFV